MSQHSAANKASPAARKKARKFAMQALYQWHLASANLTQIEAEFRADNDMSKVDLEYFHDILHGVPKEISQLDALIEPLLDRSKDELTPVELSILRLSAYEMLHRIDVPYKVVINEGVELAKTFGATDGHKYVNGIIDKLAQQVRTVEVSAVGHKRNNHSGGSNKKVLLKKKAPKISYKKSDK